MKFERQPIIDETLAIKILNSEMSNHSSFPSACAKYRLNNTLNHLDDYLAKYVVRLKQHYCRNRRFTPIDKKIKDYLEIEPIPELKTRMQIVI